MEHVTDSLDVWYEVIEKLPFDDKLSLGLTLTKTGALTHIGWREVNLAERYLIIERFFDERMNCWAGRVVRRV